MHKGTIDTQPKFSVVMPIYNVRKYLCESVESVLNQTYRNLELIMVDDGSTDGCYEICENYQKQDSRCRVIHQENKGLLLARRAGIKVASGDYLINVDSDDKCALSMLEELAAIINIKSPDMIIYNYSRINDDGKTTSIEPLFQKEITQLTKEWIIQTFISKVVLNMMWIKCTRLSVVDVNVDYSIYGKINMAEDQLQSAALFENSNRVFYYNKPLYFYRDNSESITRKMTSQMTIDSLKAKQRVLLMLENLGASESMFVLFYRKYYRTLNMYITKNVRQYHKWEEYKAFRDEVGRYELGNVSDAKIVDIVLYYILKSNFFLLIKAVGVTYNKFKN